MRMFARPMSRYSSRVLKTAPSQWVCGMSQNVPFGARGLRLLAQERARPRRIEAHEASKQVRGRMVIPTRLFEG